MRSPGTTPRRVTPAVAPVKRRNWSHLFSLVACTVLLTGCSKGGQEGGTWLSSLIADISPPTPTEAALDAFDVYDADKRRNAIALLSAAPFGGEQPYLRVYRMLLGREPDGGTIAPDPDPTVRAAAVRALGMHGDVDDATLLVAMLEDEASFVRWAAAQSLQRIHNPIAAEPLCQAMLRDEDVDVRMAAACAVGQYAQPRVFNSLVGALDDRNYAVVSNAQLSLVTLTGYGGGDHTAADWLEWAVQHRDNLFADQQEYTYQPYVKPPGMMSKLAFWKKTPPPPRLIPTGMELAKSDEPVNDQPPTDIP